jgi:hypothetical protein
MPFGKYQGIELDEIPDDYIVWCLDKLTRLGPGLRRAMEARLEPTDISSDGIMPRVHDAIAATYRRMSRRFHPDHGGTNDQHIVVNEFFEALRRAIREVTPSNSGGDF